MSSTFSFIITYQHCHYFKVKISVKWMNWIDRLADGLKDSKDIQMAGWESAFEHGKFVKELGQKR